MTPRAPLVRCVMELYVYLRMGGSWEDIRMHLMSKEALSAVAAFDVSKARCYHAADRHKLLAVIEAGFGTFAPFNKIVRTMIKTETVVNADASVLTA